MTATTGRTAARSRCIAVAIVGYTAIAAAGSSFAASSPPTLDCNAGVDGARAAAANIPGAAASASDSFDAITSQEPDSWRVEYRFTTPVHPAHPAVTLRTQIKQVTGVWTSQSKGCGFGDQSQFQALMSAMKTRDSELTNASRAEVESTRGGPMGAAP